MRLLRVLLPLVFACVVAACSSDSSTPASPSPSPSGTLAKPAADSPADGAQLDNFRPTLTVSNVTGQGSTVKTYEFEVSDSSTFASTASKSTANEDSTGKTKVTLTQDLQATTKYYWRSRVVQGTTTSPWSDTRSFNTKLVGYNRPGALYDPLIHGETIGHVSGSTTWVPGQGIKMNHPDSFVIYQLPQTYSSGEMSVEVTGLGVNGTPGKARIISMLDRDNAISSSSKYSFNLQYRGLEGGPENCITWKAVLGDNDRSVEAANRFNNIVALDPSKVYLWQGFWAPKTFRVVVREGGITGPVVYQEEQTSTASTTNWNPEAMYAFLGTNNGLYSFDNDGTRVGMTLRNLWVGSTARPAALSALAQ